MIDLSYIFKDMTTERTEERKNRFTGQSIMLTKEEAAKHDAIFINELAATLEDKAAGYDGASKLWDKSNIVKFFLQWTIDYNILFHLLLGP